MSSTTITPEQRDALLDVCDDRVDFEAEGIEWYLHGPTVAAIADDLVLTRADGSCELTLPRETLIPFLEHELMCTLEQFDTRFLRRWHVCVMLLQALEHEPQGGFFDGMQCGCADCERDRAERADRDRRVEALLRENPHPTLEQLSEASGWPVHVLEGKVASEVRRQERAEADDDQGGGGLMATGITKRHSRGCATRKGGDSCNCAPSWEASVYSRRENRKIRKTFPTQAAAKAWRADSQTAVRRGTMKAPTSTKVSEAAETWLAGARDGTIRPRSGDPYKPGAIRAYETSLRLRILPAFGHMRLGEVTRVDLQDLVDRLLAEGLNPSTISTTLLPLRAIYRRALSRGDVAVNPTSGVEMPAVRSGRDRIASPEEAAQLIAAVPVEDRALWATAMYAGLRRGELQALRWGDVDLAGGVLHVEQSWDAVEGPGDPKSVKGRRKVPVAAVLRDFLVEHRMRAIELANNDLVFGRDASRAFRPGAVGDRANRAWRDAGLERIVLHECRHTFASLMIAAGVNAKALSTYMGHANISITLDRYGHLMPGNEDEAAGLLDAYLERANTQARKAAVAAPEGPLARAVARTDLATAESPVFAGDQGARV